MGQCATAAQDSEMRREDGRLRYLTVRIRLARRHDLVGGISVAERLVCRRFDSCSPARSLSRVWGIAHG